LTTLRARTPGTARPLLRGKTILRCSAGNRRTGSRAGSWRGTLPHQMQSPSIRTIWVEHWAETAPCGPPTTRINSLGKQWWGQVSACPEAFNENAIVTGYCPAFSIDQDNGSRYTPGSASFPCGGFATLSCRGPDCRPRSPAWYERFRTRKPTRSATHIRGGLVVQTGLGGLVRPVGTAGTVNCPRPGPAMETRDPVRHTSGLTGLGLSVRGVDGFGSRLGAGFRRRCLI